MATTAEINAALHAPEQTWAFRYERLSAAGASLGNLSTVLTGSGTVNWSSAAAVRRTLRFTMDDDPTVQFGSDQLRPWAGLKLSTGELVEWPVGTFLLSTPTAQDTGGGVQAQVDGYDRAQVLLQDKVLDRYSVETGEAVTAAVATLLASAGLRDQNVQASPLTLPVAREWPLGTPKATIIAKLLDAINYAPLRFDGLGVAQVLPFVPLAERPVSHEYADDTRSVLLPGIQRTLDYFSIPNVFVGIVSQADRATLRADYVNENPDSPTSTAARGRAIVDVDTSMDAVDQATLVEAVARRAADASQVYETIPFATGLMPTHGDEDVVRLTHSRLAVDALYTEVSWAFPLKIGGTMQHQLRRLVAL